MLMYAKLMKTMVKVGVLLITGLSSPASAVTFTYTGAAQTYVITSGCHWVCCEYRYCDSGAWWSGPDNNCGNSRRNPVYLRRGDYGSAQWRDISGIWTSGGSSDVRKGGNTTANIVAIAGAGGGMGDVNTSGGDGYQQIRN